jgi:hypothetical protein
VIQPATSGQWDLALLLALPVVPAIPVAAGIAILRYRLYEIDRLINRTLVYGLLTAVLGLGYVAGSLLFVLVAGASVDPPSGLVAAATLAAAAVFRPARRRIQRQWTGASTVATTTRPRRSRPSALASATRSTWPRSRPSCWRWSTRPWNPPRRRCGCDRP